MTRAIHLFLVTAMSLGCDGLIQTDMQGSGDQQTSGGESGGPAGGVAVSGPQAAPGGPAASPGGSAPGGQTTAAPTGPGGTGDQAEDARALAGVAQQLRDLGNRSEWTLSDTVTPGAGHITSTVTGKLAKQQEAERVGALARPVYEAFKARYVAGLRPDQSASNELRNMFGNLGPQVSNDYVDADNILQYVGETAPRNSARCVEILRTSADRSRLQHINELFRTQILGEARSLLDICPRFQPDNAQLQATMEQLRPQVEAVLNEYREAEMAAIRARNWESNASVSAGSAPQLAAAGLQWLRGHPNWGGNELHTQVLGVVVRGDWFVAARNIFGQPTKYGLPVHVAVRNDRVQEGVARVYELTLVTAAPNKAPPFGEYRVGNVWQILAERVR